MGDEVEASLVRKLSSSVPGLPLSVPAISVRVPRRNTSTHSLSSSIHLTTVHLLPPGNLTFVLRTILALLLQNLITIPHVVAMPTLRFGGDLLDLIREEM